MGQTRKSPSVSRSSYRRRPAVELEGVAYRLMTDHGSVAEWILHVQTFRPRKSNRVCPGLILGPRVEKSYARALVGSFVGGSQVTH